MRLFVLLLFSSVVTAQLRFQNWFPNSADSFADVSTDTCGDILTAYTEAYNNATSKAAIDLGLRKASPVYALCRQQVSCILEHVSEATKASMATAGIVLGLLPTLLVILSPSVNELALLAVQRPLLASLLSLASPGVLQTRPFQYDDPLEIIDSPSNGLNAHQIRSQLAFGPWPAGTKLTLISICQYVLVCASIVNTLHLAWELGARSVLTWGCTRTWPTIVWVFVPLVIHWIAAEGCRLTLNTSGSHPNTSEASTSAQDRPFLVDSKPNLNTSVVASGRSDSALSTSKPRRRGGFRDWVHHELRPCAAHPATPKGEMINLFTITTSTKRLKIGVALNCVAGFLSFWHLVYGTVTFSGLLFIDTLDAVGQIAMRFLVSCLVCRFVTLIEVAGLRGSIQARAAAASRSP